MRPELLVPAKRFSLAKSRLAPVLSAPQRAALAQRMFEHVLGVAAQAELSATVLTDGDDVETLARARGLAVLRDRGVGLGPALRQALEGFGRRPVLVLMADLPTLCAADLRAARASLADFEVLLAPDREEAGTNALGLQRADLLLSHFGHADSFSRHLSAARGHRLHIMRSPGLAADLDHPAHLSVGGDPPALLNSGA